MKIILCGLCLKKIEDKNYFYIDLRPQNQKMSLVKEKVVCMDCAKKIIDDFTIIEDSMTNLIEKFRNKVLPTESPEK